MQGDLGFIFLGIVGIGVPGAECLSMNNPTLECTAKTMSNLVIIFHHRKGVGHYGIIRNLCKNICSLILHGISGVSL
jgi:hypothetical protein